jgi:hypothetical protein
MKWVATIFRQKTNYLGAFDTELEAAQAYDKAARLIPGRKLNFQYSGSEVVAGAPSVRRYIGVTQTARGRWRAQVNQGGNCLYLGTFDTDVEAAQAFDKAARLIPGRKLNFPSSQNEVLVDAPSVTTVDVTVSNQDARINDVILNDHSEDDDDDNDDSAAADDGDGAAAEVVVDNDHSEDDDDDDDSDDDNDDGAVNEVVVDNDHSEDDDDDDDDDDDGGGAAAEVVVDNDHSDDDDDDDDDDDGDSDDDSDDGWGVVQDERTKVWVGYYEHNGETVLEHFESELEGWIMHKTRVCVCVLFTYHFILLYVLTVHI